MFSLGRDWLACTMFHVHKQSYIQKGCMVCFYFHTWHALAHRGIAQQPELFGHCAMSNANTEVYTNIMQGKKIKLRLKDDSFHRWLALRLSRATPQVVQVCEDINLLSGTGCDLIVRPRVGPAAGCGRAVLVSLKMPHRSRPALSRRTTNPDDAIL